MSTKVNLNIEFKELTKDCYPEPHTPVLVLLRSHKVEAYTMRDSDSTTKSVNAVIVPAVLEFMQDGFGDLHPQHWEILKVRNDNDDILSKAYRTEVSAMVKLTDVLAFAPMGDLASEVKKGIREAQHSFTEQMRDIYGPK